MHTLQSWTSLVAQLVKNLLAMQETWVRSLGWEDPLEKGKATHSSILAWRIPWTVHGVAKSWTWLSNWTELNWIQTRWRQWKRPNAVYSRSGSEWSCSVVSDSFLTPWTVASQAPLSMEFSRQEYWSGLPFPSPGDLPTQGLKLGLLNCRQILYLLGHLSL